VSIGLFSSGCVAILFAITPYFPLQIALFIIMGFSLSMLRGPLVKVISENTLPEHARICCVFLSFAGFAGPLVASGLSLIFSWKYVFIVAGCIVILTSLLAFIIFSSMEKKGLIVFKEQKKVQFSFRDIFKVFSLESFKFYMLVGALVEISTASINFWIPTYMNQRLGFSPEISSIIFSINSIVHASCPFVALIILKFFRYHDSKMLIFTFFTSAMLFASLIFVTNPYINVVLFILALVFVGFSSALLWSVYIPSQSKSGMVSTVNGVLDFSGYAASFLANLTFTFTMSLVGWNGIIIMWVALMLIGCGASVYKKAHS
jgi:sugar phosphate permease